MIIDVCIWYLVGCGIVKAFEPRIVHIQGANPTLVSAGVEVRHSDDYVLETKKSVRRESKDSLSQSEIENLISQYFPENSDIMIKIAKLESNFNPNAVHINTNGTKDIGLMQVNSIHGYDEEWIKNPVNNLKAARIIYDTQGLSAWVTYKKYL